MSEDSVTSLDDSQSVSMASDIGLFDTSSTFHASGSPIPDARADIPLSTAMQHNETIFQLLAENCYLKLTLCKNRQEQQAVISSYAVRFSQLNSDPKRHARAYLKEEMVKHGVSHRTFLRMLPTALKDYSKITNRLGKIKSRAASILSVKPMEEQAASCICEPD